MKIVVLGGAGVGKSSLIKKFLDGDFCEQYKKTIEDYHEFVFPFNDNTCYVSMIDTSGVNDFPVMRKEAIKKCDVVMMVYSSNDLSSVEYLNNIYNEIIAVRPFNVPIIIVGNKTEGCINNCDIQHILGSWSINAFCLECSAKDNWNVDLTFVITIGAVLAQRNKQHLCSNNSV